MSAVIDDLIERIDAVLPQTQCARCGYAGCKPYAEALASGRAEINQCPPGGAKTIARLAHILRVPIKPLNPKFGKEGPLLLAVIDESSCIGCTLCIKACPVDAIVGATKQMHTVLAKDCTGCALCLPPCPVNCISLVPARRAWLVEDAMLARRRYQARLTREASPAGGNGALKSSAQTASATASSKQEQQKKAAVAAAIERARCRLRGHTRAR